MAIPSLLTGYPESAHGYPESAYEPSPHSSSHPSAQGAGLGPHSIPLLLRPSRAFPYGADPSSFGGPPRALTVALWVRRGLLAWGVPPSGGAPVGYRAGVPGAAGALPGSGRLPGRGHSISRVWGKQYEDEVHPGSDGRPHSQGSGAALPSLLEFPLGANPARESPLPLKHRLILGGNSIVSLSPLEAQPHPLGATLLCVSSYSLIPPDEQRVRRVKGKPRRAAGLLDGACPQKLKATKTMSGEPGRASCNEHPPPLPFP